MKTKKYFVEIVETVYSTIEVEAFSEQDAMERAYDNDHLTEWVETIRENVSIKAEEKTAEWTKKS